MDGLEKKFTRAEKMLSLEQVQRILQSPEMFTQWVARASYEDFVFLLSGINYTLYTHIGTPEEPADEIERGIKKNANMVVRYEHDELEERAYRVMTFVPPRGEDLTSLLSTVFVQFQSLIGAQKFAEAGRLLAHAIALFQPFPDGNKRTARAVGILLAHVGTTESLDVRAIIQEKFSSRKIADDVRADIDAVFNAYARSLRYIQRMYLERCGLTHVYDAREESPTFEAWDYDSLFLPNVTQDMETQMRVSADEASDLLFELRGILSLYNENLSTQIAPLVAFDTLEAFPQYELRHHVLQYHDGVIPTIQVPLFIRTLLQALDEPLSVQMLAHFFNTFREMRNDALRSVCASVTTPEGKN